MKKSIALLLTVLIVLSALTFVACGGSEKSESGKKVDETNLSFSTLADLKKSGTEYEFIKANKRLADDLIVCEIKSGAEGDLTIPAEYDGKEVVAVYGSAEAYDKVTSLTLENGVSFIENCFPVGAAVKSLTLPASVKGIYASFNECGSLTEVVCQTGIKYIVGSFCKCDALAKAETNGYVYGIAESFNNDAKLAAFAFNGSIQKIEGSFLETGVTSVSFPENIHDIITSFNSSKALESVVFEQIAGGVKDSFNSNDALTTLTYKQGGEQILKSFNKNGALEKVDFGTGVGNISDSFRDCPKYSLPEPPAE